MKTVGITGGIGSGKTTVCEILRVFKIPVYYADIRAKELYEEDEKVKEAVIRLFGESIYTNEGLNRQEVAARVFSNKELLQKLNKIVHPAVERDFFLWCEKYKNEDFVVKEAAVLFENGGYKKLDMNILVTAPEDIRIKRVVKRDGVSADQVLARIRNQWNDEKKIPLADFVIKCDEENLVLPQLLHVVKEIKEGIKH